MSKVPGPEIGRELKRIRVNSSRREISIGPQRTWTAPPYSRQTLNASPNVGWPTARSRNGIGRKQELGDTQSSGCRRLGHGLLAVTGGGLLLPGLEVKPVPHDAARLRRDAQVLRLREVLDRAGDARESAQHAVWVAEMRIKDLEAQVEHLAGCSPSTLRS